MKKILVTKLILLLIGLSTLKGQSIIIKPEIKQNKHHLILSNGIEKDTLYSITSIEKKNDIYEFSLWKKIPLSPGDILNLDKYRGVWLEEMPNSQSITITVKFNKDSVISSSVLKKSMDRRFNADYQINLPIKNYQLMLADSSLSFKKKIYGNFKAFLPIEFGWMPNDTILEINFGDILYCKRYKTKKYKAPLINEFKVVSNFERDTSLNMEQASLFIDTLKNKCLLEIGSSDGLGGEFTSILFYKKPFILSKIFYDRYSDIEEPEHFEFCKYQIELNDNPFKITPGNLFKGNILVASDKLPRKYGDKLIKGVTFKCDTVIYKTLEGI